MKFHPIHVLLNILIATSNVLAIPAQSSSNQIQPENGISARDRTSMGTKQESPDLLGFDLKGRQLKSADEYTGAGPTQELRTRDFLEGFAYGLAGSVLALAVLGKVMERTRNCHQFDLLYYQCIPDFMPAPDTRLIERVTWNMTSISSKPEYMNACLGGDGVSYQYHNEIAPRGELCHARFIRYETRVKVWRWRENWKFCAGIDRHAETYVRGTGMKYWMHIPKGRWIKCRTEVIKGQEH